MTAKLRKLCLVAASATVIVGAVGWAITQTVVEGAEYYKHVEEVMVSPEPWYG